MYRRFALVAAIAAISLTNPSWAIDGERLISQAVAIRGGVTPGDAPGFPVTLTEPGSYKLATNLLVPTGQDGIAVAHSNVAINLNGWRIYGGADSGRFGIAGTQTISFVTVSNGFIQRFHRGVKTIAPYWTVRNVSFTGNNQAVDIGDFARITGNRLNDNYIGAHCALECLIADNSFEDNAWDAVQIGSGLVLSNSIRNNGGLAILRNGTSQTVGFGDNAIIRNRVVGGRQTNAFPLTSNLCDPAC